MTLLSSGDAEVTESDDLLVNSLEVSQGSLSLTVGGNLSATLAKASANATLKVGGTGVVKKLSAGSNLSIETGGLLDVSDISGQSAEVTSGGTTKLTSALGDLTLLSSGDAEVTESDDLLVNSLEVSQGSLSLTVGGNLSATLAKASANATLKVGGTGVVEKLSAGSNLSIETGGLLDVSDISGQSAEVISGGTTKLTGALGDLTLLSSGDAEVTESDDLLVNSLEVSQGSLSLTVGGNLSATLAKASANATLKVGGTGVVEKLSAGSKLSIETGGLLDVSDISGQSAVVTSGGTTKLTGALGDLTLLSSRDAEVTESDDLLVNSLEVLQGSLSLTVGGNLSASLAKASANATLKVGGTGVVEKLSAGSKLSVETGGLLDVSDISGQSAVVTSGGTTKLTGALGDLTLLSSGDAEVTESDDLLANSLEVSQGSLSLTVGGNLSGTFAKASANATLKVGGTGVVEKLSAGSKLSVETGGLLDVSDISGQSAEVTSGGTTKLTGSLIDLELISANTATIREFDSLSVVDVEVTAGDLFLTAGENIAINGGARVSENMTVQAGELGTGSITNSDEDAFVVGETLTLSTGSSGDVRLSKLVEAERVVISAADRIEQMGNFLQATFLSASAEGIEMNISVDEADLKAGSGGVLLHSKETSGELGLTISNGLGEVDFVHVGEKGVSLTLDSQGSASALLSGGGQLVARGFVEQSDLKLRVKDEGLLVLYGITVGGDATYTADEVDLLDDSKVGGKLRIQPDDPGRDVFVSAFSHLNTERMLDTLTVSYEDYKRLDCDLTLLAFGREDAPENVLSAQMEIFPVSIRASASGIDQAENGRVEAEVQQEAEQNALRSLSSASVLEARRGGFGKLDGAFTVSTPSNESLGTLTKPRTDGKLEVTKQQLSRKVQKAVWVAENSGNPEVVRKVTEILKRAEDALDTQDKKAYEEALKELEDLIELPNESEGEEEPVPEEGTEKGSEPEASLFRYSPQGEMAGERFEYSSGLYDGTEAKMGEASAEGVHESCGSVMATAGFGVLHIACGAMTALSRIIRPRKWRSEKDKRAA